MVGGTPLWARLSRRFSNSLLPPQKAAAPSSPPQQAEVSRAAADLMLLLLRHNVPNAEVFAAKTDRELALVAERHGIELPFHLAHLPSLPVPRTASEKALLADEMASMEAALEGEEVVKDRPPRKARLALSDVRRSSFAAIRRLSSGSLGLGSAPAPKAAAAAAAPTRSSEPMDDGYLTGTASKDSPPTRKKKRAKAKAEKASESSASLSA